MKMLTHAIMRASKGTVFTQYNIQATVSAETVAFCLSF